MVVHLKMDQRKATFQQRLPGDRPADGPIRKNGVYQLKAIAN